MRILGTLLLLLAFPTFASAQQADAVEEAPVVELQQSTPSPSVDPASAHAEAPAPDVEVQSRDIPAESPAAAMQEPGSRQWWYLVGAIVVGGLILAVLL
jgi:hypothetical protein